MSHRKRKITWKILAFRLAIGVLLTTISGEIAMRLGCAVFLPTGLSVNDLIQKQDDLRQSQLVGRRNVQPNVLHPYVGFVVDPGRNPRFNSLGFWQVDGPLLRRSSDTVTIGITGGSVARELCEYSAETLRASLSARLPGKQVQIVCLAQDGFREPQLAMTLSYFQTLGAEFDIVVSLSGFNEAALHPVESSKDELWIGYPRSWDTRLTDTEDPELNRLIWEGQVLQMKRRDLAAQTWRFRHIPLLLVHGVWSAIDSGYRNKLHETYTSLTEYRNKLAMRYANTGPRFRYPSKEAQRNAQCEMWCNGTRQLHRLCQSTKSKFLLCLQPNIFDSAGKPLTEEESQLLHQGSMYKPWVVQNFSYFAAMGETLREEGIVFHDLRDLYSKVTTTVYRDDCCHFTNSGNDLLAERIAELVANELN